MLEYFYYLAFIYSALLIDLSKNYKMLTLEDPSLCSPIVKRRIKLGSELQSALIVSINSLADHTLDWDKNFFCKFQVEVSESKRIFAVIQNLAFRKNLDTNECIDYLHMKRSDGTISKKYCGNISAINEMDSNYRDQDERLQANNTFDDYTGMLDVNIYIAKDALMFNENMELKVVFTAYRPACPAHVFGDQECGNKYNTNCIYKGFLNDGFINCPDVNCVDEGGCGIKPTIDDNKKSVGNKVIISTVSILFIAFVIFICFIWLCRKYQKLCWSEQFSSSNNTRTTRPGAVIEMNEPPIHEEEVVNATSDDSTEEDKDLPPSYDSLFPNR